MNRRPLSDYRWYAIGFALARLKDRFGEEECLLRRAGEDSSSANDMYLYFRNRLREHRQRMRRNIRYNVDSGVFANDRFSLMAAFAKIRSAIDEGFVEPIHGLKMLETQAGEEQRHRDFNGTDEWPPRMRVIEAAFKTIRDGISDGLIEPIHGMTLHKGQNWHLLLGNEAYLKKMEELTDSFGMFPSADKPTYIYPQFRDVLTQEDVAVFTPIAAAERMNKYDAGGRVSSWSSVPRLTFYPGSLMPPPVGNYKVVTLSSGVLPVPGACVPFHGSAFCAIPKGVCAVEWFATKNWHRGGVRYYVTDFIPCDVEFVDAEIRRY